MLWTVIFALHHLIAILGACVCKNVLSINNIVHLVSLHRSSSGPFIVNCAQNVAKCHDQNAKPLDASAAVFDCITGMPPETVIADVILEGAIAGMPLKSANTGFLFA